MTQLEFIVWQYIEANPNCTSEDILGSFVRAPEVGQLAYALECLEAQELISKGQVVSEDTPLFRYAPGEIKA